MNIRNIFIISFLIVIGGAGRGEEFAFTRKIELDISGESLAGLPFDRDTFHPGHLRIQDSKGASVPLLIRKVPKTRILKVQTLLDHNVVSLNHESGNAISMVCRISNKQPPPDRIVIETPLHDFERRVRVEASQNGNQWTPLVTDYLIFDYRQIADIRRTEIPLPENEARHFRIYIDEAIEKIETPFKKISRSSRKSENQLVEIHENIRKRPFRIDRLSFYTTTSRKSTNGYAKREYPVTDFSVIKKSDDEEHVFEWIGSEIPVNAIQIVTPQRNFHRRVSVYGKVAAASEWRSLKQDTISKYELENFSESDLVIHLSGEQRMVHYRLVIAENKSRPVSVEKIIMVGPQYEAVWLAAEDTTYTAVFTSEVPQNQDQKALETFLEQGFPIKQSQWGSPLLENPAFTGSLSSRFAFFNDPRILWAAIGVAVFTLLVLLIWAVRKIDHLPE